MNYVQHVINKLHIEIPDLDPWLALQYAQLTITKGEATTPEDVHDAWAIWRNYTKPDHASIVPFDQLTPEVQELDLPYMNAIHTVARNLPRRGDYGRTA